MTREEPEGESADGLESVLADIRRRIEEERTLSLEDVAERVGMGPAILRQVLRAVGRDREMFGERDVAYLEKISRLMKLLSLDAIVRATRVRERAVRSMVVNDLGIVRDEILRPIRDRGGGADAVGDALLEVASEMSPIAAELIADDYLEILVRALDTELVLSGARGRGQDVEAAVGFVDLVGYTSLTARMAPEGLENVLSDFDDLVSGAVEPYDTVFTVKLLGDAAMLVGENAEDLADVLLEVVVDREVLPDMPRSAGISAGRVVVREGDYYGDPVNLAARLTSHARPWSLLADEELGARLADRFATKKIPPAELRGFGSRRPVSVRPADRQD
jgi:adenylate cyclase